jgi:hypothetical protein
MIAVLGYAVLLKYAGWILFSLWILLSGRAIQRAMRAARVYDREVDLDREAERECLIIRANYENRMAALGDPAGVYGHYTPPTVPLTLPLPNEPTPVAEPRDWYDYEPNNPYHLFGGNC